MCLLTGHVFNLWSLLYLNGLCYSAVGCYTVVYEQESYS